MRCILVGNYGVDNLGDEALRAYFVKHFPEIEWQVVTAAGEYPRLPLGLRSLFRPWWRTIGAIRRCDAVVFGGGSLFTDVESWKAPVLWWWYAFVAWWHKRNIILAFQGIGPCQGKVAKWATGWVLLRATFISVRDPKSYERVSGFLGYPAMESKVIVQTFDPAIAIFKGTSHHSTRKLIIVPRANTTKYFIEAVQQRVAETWDEVVILLLEPDADQAAAQQVRQAIQNKVVRTVDVRSFETLASEVAGSQFVVTQRFHGAIAAMANGIRFRAVPQKPGDKLDEANAMNPDEAWKLLQIGENALRGFLRKG